MAVKIVRQAPLNFWERLYLPAVLSGLWLTSAHFFRNLFVHAAHCLGFLKNIPAGVTQPPPLECAPGGNAPVRGLHAL
ncbi:MAG: hypothetical protein HY747_11710 [Elusimicrobia bacterium]|nr:hypothetical protein [Elusimicrobiota bacterium]